MRSPSDTCQTNDAPASPVHEKVGRVPPRSEVGLPRITGAGGAWVSILNAAVAGAEVLPDGVRARAESV